MPSTALQKLSCVLLAGALITTCAPPLAAGPKGDSLTAMFSRYISISTSPNVRLSAEFILPSDLGMAKRILLDALTETETYDIDAFEMLQPYFPTAHNIKDLRFVDSVTLYGAFCSFVDEIVPEYSNKEMKLKYQILGVIDDTPDSKYIIYRCYNSEFSRVSIDIAVYENGHWYLSLEGSWTALRGAILGSCALQRMKERR